MYNLWPLLWSRRGAPMLGSTICCRCFGLEVLPNGKMYVAVPSVKKYDLLPLLWSRNGAPVRRCTICCRCFGLEVVKKYNWFSLKWCTSARKHDLLPSHWSRSGAPVLGRTTCCRVFGLEVVPQCDDQRFVAAALVSKWCSSANMHDLLPFFWSRNGAPVLRCTIGGGCFGLEAVHQC